MADDGNARVDGVKRGDVPELEEVFQLVEVTMGFLPNSMLIMAKKPGLVEAFAGLGGLVLGPSVLADSTKRLVAFMASRAAGCIYCQAHTHHQAALSGVPEDKLDAIWDYERSDKFSEAERAAIRVAQSAGQVPNAVTAEDMAALKAHFSDEEIVDMVAVISLFGFLNRWNDTFATALEAGPMDHAKAHLAGHGWDTGKHAR